MSELRSHVSRGGVVADGSGHELCEILGTPMGTNTIVTASPAPRRREPLRLRLLALYEPSWIDLCPLSLLFNRLHATLSCKVTRLYHTCGFSCFSLTACALGTVVAEDLNGAQTRCSTFALTTPHLEVLSYLGHCLLRALRNQHQLRWSLPWSVLRPERCWSTRFGGSCNAAVGMHRAVPPVRRAEAVVKSSCRIRQTLQIPWWSLSAPARFHAWVAPLQSPKCCVLAATTHG